jgi:hypothetical protein
MICSEIKHGFSSVNQDGGSQSDLHLKNQVLFLNKS